MNSIVTEIANIIKSEDNYIKRERKIICFFLNLIKEIMALALAKVDDEMITKVKAQGYQIDKKNERSINMAFGEVRYVRRRYVCPGKQARYPLDELMGFDKYKRYSILAVKNILEVSSVATYRNTALAANCLSGFNISHMQVGNWVKMAEKNIKAGQEADSRYDAAGTKKKVPVLYLEGDGVVIKGTKSRLETYDGVFYNAKYLIEKLGRLCDYILFDCAWGGYEQFVDVLRDLSPLQLSYGPDDPGILVTQSIHKQQAGIAQASQILKKDGHLKGQKRYVDHKHFNHAYLKYVTTSYSYPIYSSLVVNAKMANSPACKSWWDDTVKLSIKFRKRLLKESKLFRPLVPLKINGKKWQDISTEVLMHDKQAWKLSPSDDWHGFNKIDDNEVVLSPLKLTVLNPGIDLSGEEYAEEGIPGVILENYLHEEHIIPEKSDIYSTLYLITPGESNVDMETLFDALMRFEHAYLDKQPLSEVMPQLVKKFPDCYKGYTLYQLCQEMHQYYKQNHIFELERDLFLKTTFQDYVMKPGQADFDFNENKSQLVELDNLKGRIALEGALPYPPGVFIVAPGEKWQQIDIDYFKILLGAAATFPGFEPEVQGVYKDSGKIVGEVLRK